MKYNKPTLAKWEKYSFRTNIVIFGRTVGVEFFESTKWKKRFGDKFDGLEREYNNDLVIMISDASNFRKDKWRFLMERTRATLVHELGHYIEINGFFSSMKNEEIFAEGCAIVDSYRHQIDKVMKDLEEDIVKFDKEGK